MGTIQLPENHKMSSPSTTSGRGQSPKRSLASRFALSIRREKHGPETKRVPVPAADVRDFKQELLLKYALRRGMPGATLDDVTIEMSPVYDAKGSGSLCRGLRVVVVNSRGDTFRQDYNAYLFSDVATRAVTELIGDGVLTLEDTYHYELVIDESVGASPDPASAGMSFGSGPTQEPLQYLTYELESLMSQAHPEGEPNSEHFPVFYTADAYQRAERFARRGADTHPPRETGAALIGSACSCPESGEFYVVITDALEATDAVEKKGSLSYTGKTWLSLQAILRSIQLQPETRTYRFLGQAHGHNFLPLDGAPPCKMCSAVKVCSRTSVFVSIDDRAWTQAVFAGAPYALCHIFGLNARHEQVHGLYSLYENRLTQRGFYIIPEFDPTRAS
jgi:hypothetical protein